jgi:hypothetical protein
MNAACGHGGEPCSHCIHDAARRKLGWIIGQWYHLETVVVSPFVAEQIHTRYDEASHPERSAYGRWTRDVSPVC